MSALINLVCIALIIYLGLRIIQLSKRNKLNKKLIAVVDVLEDESKFFDTAENMIATVNNPEYEAKGRVLLLWGSIYYGRDELFEKTLPELDLNQFIGEKGKTDRIDYDEDSFFYLYLACPNHLFSLHKTGMMKELYDKLETVEEPMKKYLVCELGKQNRNFYENQDDRGADFYTRVLNGEYSEYKYNKQLIGLYKDVITCMQARLMLDNYDQEGFNGLLEDLQTFQKSRLGSRYIKELDLPVPEKEETKEEDSKEEPAAELSEKTEEPAEEKPEDETEEKAEDKTEAVTEETPETKTEPEENKEEPEEKK